MSLTYTRYAQTMWLENVYQMKKFQISCILIMLQYLEDTLEGTRQQQKSSNQVITGPSIFKDAYKFVKSCDKCQKAGNIS